MIKNFFSILFVIISAALLVNCTGLSPKSSASPSYEIRAAMDIGSGSTNLKVAEVDMTTNKVIKVIFEDSKIVPYQKHLEKSPSSLFDKEVMDLGIKAIKDLKSEALQHGAKKVVAVATAAFRSAKNAPEFADQIRRETGIDLYIIDQKVEGQIAFTAALSKSESKEGDVVVWDIGGGSFQLTAVDQHHEFIVSRGHFASEPFKKFIITMIQGSDINTVNSPNPMNKENIDMALTKSMQVAQETDPFIINKIKESKTKVLAVGNLFYFGIRKLADDKPVISQEDLQLAIDKMQGKSDEQLGGAYPDVRVSNAILVLGFMKELNISHMEILDINNADGVLTTEAYWK